MELNKIYQGDCLDVLKTFPDESIDCVITSPPYWGLRDYGTATWEGGDEDCDHIANPKKTKVFGNEEFDKNRPSREMTKLPGYYADICPKCGAKKVDKQLGLEKTFQEYINKLCDIFDEVKRILRKDGTCWVNLGDSYYTISGSGFENDNITGYQEEKGINVYNKVRNNKELPQKSLCQIPSRFAIEMQNRGWILRNEIIWEKPNIMPQSTKDRFTHNFEKIFFFVKNRKYYFEQQFEPLQEISKKRAEYGWHGSKLLQEDSYNGIKHMDKMGDRFAPKEGKNKRSVWQISTQGFKESHFATYPLKLIEPMIKAGCPDNGIILDPFMGAGTTAIGCLTHKKNYIGIDLNPEYIKIAEKRIDNFSLENNISVTKNEIIYNKLF